MISNTRVKSRIARKNNPIIVETIRLALKNDNWKKVAQFLSNSTSDYLVMNLEDIDKQTSAGDTVVILGKVLGSGELTKKLRICALGISKEAKVKLTKTKSEFVNVIDEIKKNPKAEGVKLLR